MQELHSLMHVLSPGEWQSLQIFLTAFTPHDPERLRYVQLAKMLMEAENSPAAETCCLKIYRRKKSPGFKMLKSRLKEKVCDFLITDLSNDKKQGLDETDYVGIKIKKKSALFQQLLQSKNKIPLVDILLDEIIFLSKQYEYYHLLVYHLRLKKTVVSWKRGEDVYEKINKEMACASQYNSIYNRAEHYYYRIGLLVAFSSKPDKQKALLTLKKNIEEVKAGFEFTNSPMVHYYLKNLEMAYYQLQGDYLKAHSVCLELLNIVRNNKSVYRRQRLAVEYDNLSQCEFYLGWLEIYEAKATTALKGAKDVAVGFTSCMDGAVGNKHFLRAAEYARLAQKIFTSGSVNYCIALEQEFYALFVMEQYKQSTAIAKKMLANTTPKELGKFRHAKYNFLLANALFKLGKYKEVINILSQKLEITKDKAGWEIGIRILTIMALVEMQKSDEASSATHRLRKFIAFTDKKTPVSLRDKIILKVLLILERAGFMFSTLNGSTEKYINMLAFAPTLKGATGNLSWEPFNHEVIPFHEWFAEKMGKTVPRPFSPQKESLLKKERREEIF